MKKLMFYLLLSLSFFTAFYITYSISVNIVWDIKDSCIIKDKN